MSHDVAISVLTLFVTLRVLIPDLLTLFRRMLGAGVRVGAAALADQRRSRSASPVDHPAPTSGRAESGQHFPGAVAPREGANRQYPRVDRAVPFRHSGGRERA